jgi:hypothetical protein
VNWSINASHPRERADDLATQVVSFFGGHWFGPPSAADEAAAELRTAAFCFLRDVHETEPLILKARDISNAVLEVLSQFHTPDSIHKLRQASNVYEKASLLR